MNAVALALVLASQQPTVPETAGPAVPARSALFPQPNPRANFLPPLVSQPPMFAIGPQRPLMLPPLETARPGERPGRSLLLPI
jgi:hypothetical protein